MSVYRLAALLGLISLLPQIGRGRTPAATAAGALVLKVAPLSTADPNTSCLPLSPE